MNERNYSKLLKLTDNYLNTALKAEARVWVLGSLFSLGQDAVTEKLPPKFPHFRKALGYLGIVTSDENWNKWLDTNASVLGNLPGKYWSQENKPPSIWSEFISPSSGYYSRAYIRTDNKEPKLIDISSVSYLKGVGDIPPLWMFSGPYVYEISYLPSKQIAFYEWVSQSISRIVEDPFNSDSSDTIEELDSKIEDFIIKHKSKLDAIRKWFKHEPKELGGGADGTAWDIGGGRILKIFSDPVSYNHAIQAMYRLHHNPSLAKTEAMIYDAGEIGKFDNFPIYFYVMEKMFPVTEISELEEDLTHIVSIIVGKIYKDRDFWREIKKKDLKANANLISDKVKEAAHRYANQIKDKYKALVSNIENTYLLNKIKVNKENPGEHVVPLNKDWLVYLAEEVIIKYLTGRTDLHMGNLGVTSYGEFRYFDPAFKNWTSNVNMGAGIVPSAERSEID